MPKGHAAARAIHISEWPLLLPDAIETFGSELQKCSIAGVYTGSRTQEAAV